MGQLVGLAKFCGEQNLGGLIRIRYAPIDWIHPENFNDMVSLANYSVMNHIIFSTGDWLEAYLLPSSKSWDEVQRKSNQGPNYNQTIKGILPKMKPAVSGEFNGMANRYFLLLLTDQNRNDWLLGSLEQPFEFKVRGKTGSKISSANNYQIEFRAQTSTMAKGYAPIF